MLRNLVELRLCGIISSELITFLLERLIVPAVEEIAIFGNIFEDSIPIIPLVTSMISRSTNAYILQRLSLRESNYHPGEFTALLRLTPRLVFLDIRFPPIDDLVHLALIDSANPIVPLLHTLVLTDDQHYTYYTKAIVMLLAKGRCEETTGPLIAFDAPEPSRALDVWPFGAVPAIFGADVVLRLGLRIRNKFVCSKNFKRWVGPLTKVQKIMALNKAMVNHKLEEVKHLFVRPIPFFYSN